MYPSPRAFFPDGKGLPWKDADAFRDAFNRIRDVLAKTTPSVATRYYVGLDPEDALGLPTAKPTMRTMRATAAAATARRQIG